MRNSISFNIETIIDEYSNYVFKIVNNIVGTSLPYEDKEEIVADVFYLLWKNQDYVTKNLKSYLAVIARNSSYSKLRNKKTTVELRDELIADNLTFNIDNLADKIVICQKISKLTKLEKIIFTLYYVDGYKIKEISEKLRLSSSGIKIKLYRIRKKLKEEIL